MEKLTNLLCVIFRTTVEFGTDILENKKRLHTKTLILTDCFFGGYIVVRFFHKVFIF